MKDNINFFNERQSNFFGENGRQPYLFWKPKTTSILLKIEENLNYFEKWKTTSIFLNGRHPQQKNNETLNIKNVNNGCGNASYNLVV